MIFPLQTRCVKSRSSKKLLIPISVQNWTSRLPRWDSIRGSTDHLVFSITRRILPRKWGSSALQSLIRWSTMKEVLRGTWASYIGWMRLFLDGQALEESCALRSMINYDSKNWPPLSNLFLSDQFWRVIQSDQFQLWCRWVCARMFQVIWNRGSPLNVLPFNWYYARILWTENQLQLFQPLRTWSKGNQQRYSVSFIEALSLIKYMQKSWISSAWYRVHAVFYVYRMEAGFKQSNVTENRRPIAWEVTENCSSALSTIELKPVWDSLFDQWPALDSPCRKPWTNWKKGTTDVYESISYISIHMFSFSFVKRSVFKTVACFLTRCNAIKMVKVSATGH